MARFIVIESLDGVGKTTLVRNLAAALGGVAMSMPGPALKPLREQIHAALGDARIAHALFYLALAAAEGGKARAAADAGRTVVMDRFLASAIAYARARGVAADFDALLPALPRPDVSVLLTLDEDERVRRLGARGEMSVADTQSLDPVFRGVVMAELGARCDLQVDVTGADEEEAVRRVIGAVGYLPAGL
ncbi:AAA family ATPase [Azotobacter beijerinckii]|uniref:dTMP kinase n=1 Tax=Azotobacter beijerinckii TaxID=170623 RepID=A0A1I4H9N2_9GAMM|nr:AAA family ATPase [Azotobacter beijerinckii]SFB60887.1 dTMP kinase [Azotobacter beijerinckii]SFL39012.1 dTMP kinase [Azotobacter beijerinckii]